MWTFLAVGGVLAVAGALLSAYSLRQAPHAAGDVEVISRGEEVNLTDHLAPGKYTVFDFYAVWCPPCRVLSPALERLAAAHPDVLAVRKVDIVDWTLPVAAQHGIESLPYLVLYDPDGELVGEGDAVFGSLTELFGNEGKEIREAAGGETEADPELWLEGADSRALM